MEEIKTFSFFFSADIFPCQLIVLFKNRRHILPAKRIVLCICRHHRLHGDLLKSLVRQVFDILGEIQIIPCKSASYIIIHLVSALRHLLVLWNHFIIASLPASVGPHQIMDLPASVYAQDYVRHFPVDERKYLIIQKHTVGGQRKAEFLMTWLLQAPAVSYQVFHHLPV